MEIPTHALSFLCFPQKFSDYMCVYVASYTDRRYTLFLPYRGSFIRYEIGDTLFLLILVMVIVYVK